MSACDRAFIKAFAEKTAGPAPERPATPSPAPVRAVNPTAPVAPVAASETRGSALGKTSGNDKRAPLSVFTAETAVRESVRPALEVERIAWPAVCDKLIARAKGNWATFIEQITRLAEEGHKCVAITSAHRSEGRTTVCLAAAREIANRGLKVVLVEADLESPKLARACAISPQAGWDALLEREMPLGEALIESREDGVTLMPWQGPPLSLAQVTPVLRVGTAFGQLRDHYDVVLLDAGPLSDAQLTTDFARFAAAVRIDAVYIVQDVRWTLEDQLAGCCEAVRATGLEIAGIIENYSAPSAQSTTASRGLLAAASRAWTATTQAALGTRDV